jgi:hypothetical protein
MDENIFYTFIIYFNLSGAILESFEIYKIN